ncbi:hypothetical protein [Paenibacillus odorifer]|uniref:Uncharacterized protein n=1 Tax=Paenibacillus odorifer TaxID=189426 RepID=A0A1R0Y6Q4_9BACL|nr:hypothetical protein [Paenibacillus odorifer]OMD43018.1 hypothetical protein BSK52_05830 [Paenibacillus odorifer]
MSRQKLDDYNKKKLRQIRISDAEMDYLGNPDSAWIRQALLEKRDIELKLKRLKEEKRSCLSLGKSMLERHAYHDMYSEEQKQETVINLLLNYFNVFSRPLEKIRQKQIDKENIQ